MIIGKTQFFFFLPGSGSHGFADHPLPHLGEHLQQHDGRLPAHRRLWAHGVLHDGLPRDHLLSNDGIRIPAIQVRKVTF